MAAALALVAIGLGIDGFRRHFDALGEHRSPTDLLYLTLQLFILKSGDVPPPVPWELDVARFLAPAVALSAALIAAALVFRDEAQSLRVRIRGADTIVCGLGSKGRLLAESFRGRGDRVVVVEADESNERVAECRSRGIPVVVGDAASEEALARAGIDRAKVLVAVCGDDATNARIAARCLALSRTGGSVLTAFVHVVDPRLCVLLVDARQANGDVGNARVELFNVYERSAPTWLSEHPPFRSGGDHLVVVGGNELGRALVFGAARDWLEANPEGGGRPRITLVDPAAERTVELLAARYTSLSEVCDLVPVACSTDAPEFERGGFLLDASGRPDASAVYVCLDDDRGLAAAVTLALRVRERGGASPPVVLAVTGDRGLSSIAGGVDGLRCFDVLDRTCRAEILMSSTRNELLAMATHAEYIRKHAAEGETTSTNPSMVAWEDLPEALRESNRRQADHVRLKLEAIGCRLTPRTDWRAPLLELAPDEVERLARLEHDRWRAERVLEGWTYTAGPKDLIRKTSPYLVPWERLPEEERDYDRNTVRHLPAFLAEAGLSAVRVSA